MGNELVSYSFLLLLLLVMHATGNAAGDRENADGTNVLRIASMDLAQPTEDVNHAHAHDHGHSSSSHMGMGMGIGVDDMDPSLKVLFFMKDIQVGKTIPVYFPHIDHSNSFHFLPKEEADSIPFSSKALPELLRFFSFSLGSPQAMAMEQTLKTCGMKTPKGEIKHCANSLESLLDFAHGVFGSDSQVKILKTTHLTKLTALIQNYTVLGQPKEVEARKMIACHSMPYPYAVFYCHTQKSKIEVLKVSLGSASENGDERVDAVSVCHMDTSDWDPNHVMLRLLGVRPGSSEVCHFLAADNLVLIPVSNIN